EWTLPAFAGKHSTPHARRVAGADLENTLRRIFSARSFCERDRDRAVGRRELGAGPVCFQAELRSFAVAYFFCSRCGELGHGGGGSRRESWCGQHAAAGNPARGSRIVIDEFDRLVGATSARSC